MTVAKSSKEKKRQESTKNEESRVFRANGVSYLRIPAPDVKKSARFYKKVFSWKVRTNRSEPSFEDGSGHVIGHWVSDLQVVGEAGIIPYVFVSHVKDTVDKVKANGGEVVKAPYQEGNLWVATFRDPAGNVLGIWQLGGN